MAVTTFYLLRNSTQNPPFYGGNGTWVRYANAQLFSSKENALAEIENQPNGEYTIQEKIVKS
jgi:hypothetical protein